VPGVPTHGGPVSFSVASSETDGYRTDRAFESGRAVPVRAGASKTPKQIVTGSPVPPMNLASVQLDSGQSESHAAALRGQLSGRAAAQTPASYASASPDPGESASYASASPDPGESIRADR